MGNPLHMDVLTKGGFKGKICFNTWENHGKIRNLNYEPNN